PERRSLDELHHDESIPAVDPGVEHADHVRVVETGQDLRLLLEPGDRAGIPVVEEQLDGDGSAQQGVLAPADLGHQAPPEHVPQAVALADEPRRLDVGSSFLTDRKTSTSRDTGLPPQLPLVARVTSA